MSPATGTALARLVDEIGGPGFGVKLMGLLRAQVGAAYCAAYRFGDDHLNVLSASGAQDQETARRNAGRYEADRFWERDPAIHAAVKRTRKGQRALAVHVDPEGIADTEFREYFFRRTGIVDKLLLAGRRGADLYGVAVFRTRDRGHFSPAQVDLLEGMADFLVSCSAQHAATSQARRHASAVLASVPSIEASLRAGGSRLSERELQVCARMLAGHSVQAIARELRVTSETVATYRKRAFQRLSIRSRHGLLERLLEAI